MKTTYVALLVAGILCSPYLADAQVFFAERLNLSSCLEKGDIQVCISSKAAHIYRDTGNRSYDQPAETIFGYFNQYIDAGYAVSSRLMLTASYMHEQQDGNLYITGKSNYNIGDRGRYTGNRLGLGAAFMQRAFLAHYIALHAQAFLGGQQRTPNSDDRSGRRFKTSYIGLDLCPAFGVKTDVVDWSVGPRLTYQQFYNGKATTGNAVNTSLTTAGAVMDFAIGYRALKFNVQTGLMGAVSDNKDLNTQDAGRIGFYMNAGLTCYIGSYYRNPTTRSVR